MKDKTLEKAAEYYAHNSFNMHETNNYQALKSGFYAGAHWMEIEMSMKTDYDPYCKECSGCGEEGCCSPVKCTQSPKGEYCQTYLLDLKLGYLLDRYFMQNIYTHLSEELKDQMDQAFDEIYDQVYRKDK